VCSSDLKNMRSTSTIAATLLALATAGVAHHARGDSTVTAAETATPKQKTEAPKIEPQAMAALSKMGEFLRDQQTFAVTLTSETDQVLDSGQKIRLVATGDLQVRRPDHLRANVKSDRKERQYFYDGKNFVINGPQVGYYAEVPAPSTILELADQLEDQYKLQLPLVDLFRWGSDEADTDEITAAKYIGQARLGDADTDQYAFRQPGLDWQIWIERGDKPLPRKIVLTTTDDPARPEHAITMSWNLAAKPADSVFAFTPPPDSQKIKLAGIKRPSKQ